MEETFLSFADRSPMRGTHDRPPPPVVNPVPYLCPSTHIDTLLQTRGHPLTKFFSDNSKFPQDLSARCRKRSSSVLYGGCNLSAPVAEQPDCRRVRHGPRVYGGTPEFTLGNGSSGSCFPFHKL